VEDRYRDMSIAKKRKEKKRKEKKRKRNKEENETLLESLNIQRSNWLLLKRRNCLFILI